MTPTTPPAIPSDIWEAARSLRTQVIWESNATIEVIARALLAAQERGKLMERERVDLICREEWHAIVETASLRPGTPTEKFAANILNRVREAN